MPEPEQIHPIASVVRLLAILMGVRGAEAQSEKDKIRKRLMYAVNRGELDLRGPPEAQLFFMPQVLGWARDKWPDKLRNILLSLEAAPTSKVAYADTLIGDIVPADLAKCQKTLEESFVHNRSLTSELSTAQAEIDRLKPSAEKYERNRERNRKSAKGPRKGL